MDDVVCDTLEQLCRDQGIALLDDPVLLEAFFRDACPGRKAEINCLVTRDCEGIVRELRRAGIDVPLDEVAACLVSDIGVLLAA